jgi:hypothetical protein
MTQEQDSHEVVTQTDGIQRITRGPMIFVSENGIRFQIATGNSNFLSAELRCGTAVDLTR